MRANIARDLQHSSPGRVGSEEDFENEKHDPDLD